MCPPLKPQSGQWRIGGILPATSRRWLTLIATPSASGSQLMRVERSASCSSVIPTRTIPTHNLSATQYAHMAFQLHRRKAISACRKSFFSPHGAGIHRWPSRFPCALRPKAGSLPRNGLAFSATGGASPVSPSWVSRAHPSLPSRRIFCFIDRLTWPSSFIAGRPFLMSKSNEQI